MTPDGADLHQRSDRTFFHIMLLVFMAGLLFVLREGLTPILMGGAVLMLVVLLRRGARFEVAMGTTVALLLGAWFFAEVANLLWPFVISIVLAYLLAPLVGILARHIPRSLAIGVIALLTLGAMSGIGAVVVPKIISEVSDLVSRLPRYGNELLRIYHRLIDWTQELGLILPISDIQQWMVERLPELGRVFADQTTAALKGLTSGLAALLNLLMIPFVTFYILKDYEKMVAVARRLLPPRHAPVIWDVIGRVDAVLGQYVRGQMIVSSFIAVLTSSGLALLGIRYAVLLGIMAGLFNLVPYIGIAVSLGVASVVALLDAEPLIGLLKVIGVFVVVQGVEGNFLSPKVVGERVGLHPAWVMFAVVVSAHFWGVVGMLVAIPVAAAINIVVRVMGDRYFQSRYYGQAETD